MKEEPLFNSAQSQRLNLEKETPFAASSIVSRTLLSVPGTRITLFTFDDGQELSEHTTPKRALVHVLAGQCHFTVYETAYELKAGDLLSLPPGGPHAVRAIGRFSMLLTLCSSDSKSQ